MPEIPGADASAFEWLTFEQSGVLATRQAVAAVGEQGVRNRLRGGRWRSVCRGVVSVHNGELTRRQQLWVAVLVAGEGARLAGATAIAEHGVTGCRDGPLQVLIPAGRNPSRRLPSLPHDMASVRVRRTSQLPDWQCRAGRPPRTTIGRAVVDAVAWAPSDEEAVTVLTSACQQRRVGAAEIRTVLSVLPRVRRRSLIRRVLADVEGGAGALSEVDFLALCRRHRLPPPDLQRRRADADGRWRFIDAYWAEHHLQVEIDGAHHMDVRQWAADMLRQNQIWLRGERLLRFPAWLVRTDPAVVVAQLRAALGLPELRCRTEPGRR